MGKLFAMDGKVVNILNRAADLVILNVLWLLCCIPIVTIGASNTALQYVALKMARNEESYVARTFFRVFRENFRQSTIVWGILLLVIAVIAGDLYVVTQMELPAGQIMAVPFVLLAFLTLITAQYLFPVMAFFENSTKKVIRNSFLMAVAHLPYTLAVTAIGLIPVLILLFTNIIMAVFINIIIAVSLCTWLNAFLFRKLFDRYTEKMGA